MAASSSAESKMYTASYSRDNAGNPPFGHVRLPRVAVAEGEWLRPGGRRGRRAISRQINKLARARALVKETESLLVGWPGPAAVCPDREVHRAAGWMLSAGFVTLRDSPSLPIGAAPSPLPPLATPPARTRAHAGHR